MEMQKQDFLDARVEEIDSNIISEHPKYKMLNIEADEIYKDILKLLPYDKKGMLLELDIKYRTICAENGKIMYKKGIEDGIMMTLENKVYVP